METKIIEVEINEDFNGCGACIHALDSAEICKLRNCIHAIDPKDAFEPKINKIRRKTMDLEILNDRMKKLKNELEDIMAKLEESEKEQKNRRWEPQFGEIYFYLNSCAGITHQRWTEHTVDKMRYLLGNVYKTEEEANFEEERLKVIAEMREFEESPEREWDGNNFHHYIFYNMRRKEIQINYVCTAKDNNMFFESAEKAEECINKVGVDRIKKYYLRVKED